jgi:alpha-N-acetylglucosaminidase
LIGFRYPDVDISVSPGWSGFGKQNPETAQYAGMRLIEPTDPMFVEIGNKFIALQQETYGTDHFYQCDTYNEMNPRSREPQYLSDSSSAVYRAMSLADPDAVWLMQGWLFYRSADFWKEPQVRRGVFII